MDIGSKKTLSPERTQGQNFGEISAKEQSNLGCTLNRANLGSAHNAIFDFFVEKIEIKKINIKFSY